MNISIATNCYPPYLHFLEDHLSSIRLALGGRRIPVYLLNSQMQQKDIVKADEIVAKANIENLHVLHTSEPLIIGQIRNRLFDLTDSEWTLFLDSDTTLAKDYFDQLDRFFIQHDLTRVSAIAGGIGLSSASKLGRYEGLMDMVALLGKIKNIDSLVYESLFNGNDLPYYHSDNERQFWDLMRLALSKYEGCEIRYVQGFNQIIRRKVRSKYGGYDDAFACAEDRDIAANILCNGDKILFAPNLMALHIYDFNLARIIHRKRIHGQWCQKFRDKYKHRPDVVKQYDFNSWMKFAKTFLNPPAPFNQGIYSRFYYLVSSAVYALSGILESTRNFLSTGTQNQIYGISMTSNNKALVAKPSDSDFPTRSLQSRDTAGSIR